MHAYLLIRSASNLEIDKCIISPRYEEVLDHLTCVRAWNVYLNEERKAGGLQAQLDGEVGFCCDGTCSCILAYEVAYEVIGPLQDKSTAEPLQAIERRGWCHLHSRWPHLAHTCTCCRAHTYRWLRRWRSCTNRCRSCRRSWRRSTQHMMRRQVKHVWLPSEL